MDGHVGALVILTKTDVENPNRISFLDAFAYRNLKFFVHVVHICSLPEFSRIPMIGSLEGPLKVNDPKPFSALQAMKLDLVSAMQTSAMSGRTFTG